MIPHDHLRIEQWPERKRGGQHVGTGSSGIRVTHIPSGIIACVDCGRSQWRNLAIARNMIEAAVTCPSYPGEV